MLVEQLGSPDADRRMAAARGLRALGRSAAPALERGLVGNVRVNVRRWCALLLVECARRSSACAVVTATHDRVAAVRLLALQVLADPMRGEEFALDPVPHLVRLARHDRSKRVRRAALQSLTLRLPDARAASTLADAAANPHTDPDVRRMCLDALDETAHPAVLAAR